MQCDISSEYKKNNALVRIFYVMLTVMPLSLAFINSVRYWGTRDSSAKWIILLTAALLVCLAGYILRGKENSKQQEIFSVCSIFVVAFALRLIMLDLLDTYPVSDPINAFISAKRLSAGKGLLAEMKGYYALYTHWGTWAIILGGIMRIFGATLTVATVFSAILSSLNAPIYYYAVKNICKNSRIAMLAMLFIAISPGSICYSGVLVNDHMTELCVGLFFLFLSMGYRERENNNLKKTVLFYVLAGISLGFFDVFKMIGSIMLLAVMLGEFVTNVLPAIHLWIKNHDLRYLLTKMVTSGAVCLLLLICCKGVNCIVVPLYEKILDVDIYDDSGDEFYSNLYMGLNIETEGVYAPELVVVRNDLRANYLDVKERNEQFKKLLLENLQNPKEIMQLLVHKFGVAWGDELYSGEQAFIAGSMHYNDEAKADAVTRYDEGYKFFAPTVKNLSAAFWSVLLLGGVVGAISLIFKKSDYTFLVSMIYLFGFALLMEIMLVQGRYKDIVYFPLIMLSAYGYSEGIALVRTIINKVGKMKIER